MLVSRRPRRGEAPVSFHLSIHFEPTNYLATNTYLYNIYWYEGCESTVSEIDAGRPIPDRPEVSCASLLENNHVKCKFRRRS